MRHRKNFRKRKKEGAKEIEEDADIVSERVWRRA
jgi:hypothetical protein